MVGFTSLRGGASTGSSSSRSSTTPLKDSNHAFTINRSTKKRVQCLPVRVNKSKVEKIILNDDIVALNKLIRQNPSALDYVDSQTGKTLLHQCVDNCAKLGTMYSSVALDLIRRGCSLQAKDSDSLNVIRDAHEKNQHLLLSSMITHHKVMERINGMEDVARFESPLTATRGFEDEVVVINNVKMLSFMDAENKWKMVGRACQVHLRMDRNPHLYVVNDTNEILLDIAMDAVKQLLLREKTKAGKRAFSVVMQINKPSPTEAVERNCRLLSFDNEYDMYHFSSLYSGLDQLRNRVE